MGKLADIGVDTYVHMLFRRNCGWSTGGALTTRTCTKPVIKLKRLKGANYNGSSWNSTGVTSRTED